MEILRQHPLQLYLFRRPAVGICLMWLGETSHSEMAAQAPYHPTWLMAALVTLVACGVVLLLELPILALAPAPYGTGNGIGSVTEGKLPLSLFGPDGYVSLMGRLVVPSLFAQALSPPHRAVIIARWNAGRCRRDLTARTTFATSAARSTMSNQAQPA
jgi:hypothetical protein